MNKFFIILLLLTVLYGCTQNHDIRVYLIPKDYEGPLLIIEDPKAEDTLQMRADTTIFDFREKNVLRIRGNFIEGSYSLSNLKYFFVDSAGNKIEIPIALGNVTKMDSSKAYLYLRHTRIGESSQCDLVSTPKRIILNLDKQEKLCDSLLAKRPD